MLGESVFNEKLNLIDFSDSYRESYQIVNNVQNKNKSVKRLTR